MRSRGLAPLIGWVMLALGVGQGCAAQGRSQRSLGDLPSGDRCPAQMEAPLERDAVTTPTRLVPAMPQEASQLVAQEVARIEGLRSDLVGYSDAVPASPSASVPAEQELKVMEYDSAEKAMPQQTGAGASKAARRSLADELRSRREEARDAERLSVSIQRCGQACDLAMEICRSAEVICSVSQAHASDPRFVDSCTWAAEQCESSQETCEMCLEGE